MTKSKAFADDKLNVARMMISLFRGVENTLGKGENGKQQFPFNFFSLSFPTMFSKASSLKVVKTRDCTVLWHATNLHKNCKAYQD